MTFETQTDEEKLIKEDINYLEEKKRLLEMEVRTKKVKIFFLYISFLTIIAIYF